MINTTSLELFYSNDIIDILVEESKKYSLVKNCHAQNITSDELKCFISMLISSEDNLNHENDIIWRKYARKMYEIY